MKKIFKIELTNGDEQFTEISHYCSPLALIQLKQSLSKGSKSSTIMDDVCEITYQLVGLPSEYVVVCQSKNSSSDDKLKMLGELSTNLFHELNGPLNIATSSLEILKLDMLDSLDASVMDKLNPSLDTLEIGILRILNIIKGIQGFAQNKHQYNIVTVNKFIKETVEFTKVFLKSNKVNIKISSEVLDTLKIDIQDTLISQVIINLVKNASEAIKDLSSFNRWIDIRVKENVDFLVIEIVDSGPGISPDIVAKLFSYGFSTKGVGAGHGIGLSFCHKVMIEHKGSIEYSSQYGNTCFVLTLPKNKNK